MSYGQDKEETEYVHRKRKQHVQRQKWRLKQHDTVKCNCWYIT